MITFLALAHLHTCWMLRNWSGMITFLALAHICWMLRNWSGMLAFLALAHMLDATQLVRGGWGGMITFLALAHMLDATQLVGDDNIPCTCAYVGCYATGRG